MTESALVIGATGDLGRSFCKRLCDDGLNVVAVGRDRIALQAMLDDRKIHHYIRENLDEVEALIAKLNNLGTRFSTMVLCTADTRFAPMLDRPWESLGKEIQRDVLFTTRLVHYMAAKMVEAGRGDIILIGSTAQFRPAPGLANYAAGKAFLASLARSLWVELTGTGVRIECCICGPFGTSFDRRAGIPARRHPNSPEQIVERALRGLERGRPTIFAGMGARLRTIVYAAIPPSLHRRLAQRKESK
jgi:short-subunit dehydrogenase